MQKHCNLILLAGFSATIFSGNIEANEDKSDTAHAENSYWSLTPQSWALFVATSNDRQEISLSLPEKNKHNQRINIELSPNINHLIRVGMQYQGYALSARVATIEQNSGISKTDIGATRARDWQLRSFGEHWSYELVYQRHQGFYYLDDDKNIHFNEQLLSKKSAITAIYNFNPERLNLNAAYAFTHHQERSGYAYFLYSNIKRMEHSQKPLSTMIMSLALAA